MKRFFILLIVLLVTVWVGVEITTDPGTVLITRNKYTIAMPLWLAIAGLSASFIVVYFLIRTGHRLCSLPKRLKTYVQNRKKQKKRLIENQTLLATLCQTTIDHNLRLNTLLQLKKINWLSHQQFQKLEEISYADSLKRAIHTHSEKFKDLWQQLPHRLKKNPHFINFYIQALIHDNAIEKAELLTCKLLKKYWLQSLVHTYGLIRSTQPERQLATAEHWLKEHPHDANLLLSLGRICKHMQLWGKAEDYLQKSLALNAHHVESYQELAELFEALEKPTEALQTYKLAATHNRIAIKTP